MIEQLGIKLVIGVNLMRTAYTIYEATRNYGGFGYAVPYILIIAGTDANFGLTNQNTNEKMKLQINESVKCCECLISISEQMKYKVEKYL
jgi:hypothetical protein